MPSDTVKSWGDRMFRIRAHHRFSSECCSLRRGAPPQATSFGLNSPQSSRDQLERDGVPSDHGTVNRAISEVKLEAVRRPASTKSQAERARLKSQILRPRAANSRVRPASCSRSHNTFVHSPSVLESQSDARRSRGRGVGTGPSRQLRRRGLRFARSGRMVR